MLSKVDQDALRKELKGFQDFFIRQLREGLRNGHEGLRDDGRSQVMPLGFDLDAIRVPVQVWHGERDLMVPFAHGQWIAAHVPGVEVRFMSNEGHVTIGGRHVPDVHGWLASKF
ncbi:MAG: alpha/beta fold hydrolase [Thermoplasmata archaeon]